ncbi:MAG TPA: N,N-dimethylformamidase beta subunit family domain-containing protein [Thermoanaerobaculia bacterium]|nr:N,N-dimethylformamidase beta subunit family domain-containing protein [Thermoanaerobaculia bacterium]
MPAALRLFLIAILALPALANAITDENARPGTSDWMLFSRATTQIEGYASLTGAGPGESIRFYVSTPEPSYTLEVFRMGWYGGKGGRRMTDAVTRSGFVQSAPSIDASTGLAECHWTDPYVLTIPNDWVSGVYLAKLTATSSRKGAYIIFVVRAPAERVPQFIAVTGVTKYQAYNPWGGKSLYGFNSSNGQPAVKVSFDRPYAIGSGDDEFLYRTEYNMVRFLEREGYDVEYITDIDLHEHGEQLLRAKAFLDIGHDEYWTWQMRDAVEHARDAGVNLAFFSANDCYWQIRFEDDDRTIVAYKEQAASRDPVLFDSDPSNDHLATGLWRDAPVNRPEDALIGTMYTWAPVAGDVVIGDVSSWIFANTNLHPGDRLRGLLGYEADRATGSAYPGTLVLTHSPFQHVDGTFDESNMTLYTASSGAIVFATGTIYWTWGLDDFNAAARPDSPPSAAVQQITRNVLNRMADSSGKRRRRALVARSRASNPPGSAVRGVGVACVCVRDRGLDSALGCECADVDAAARRRDRRGESDLVRTRCERSDCEELERGESVAARGGDRRAAGADDPELRRRLVERGAGCEPDRHRCVA